MPSTVISQMVPLCRIKGLPELHIRNIFRTLDKSAYQKNIFLISLKHMLWVLKRTFSLCCGYSKEPSQWDGSFEHPKHMIKLMGKKILTSLPLKNYLSKPMIFKWHLHLNHMSKFKIISQKCSSWCPIKKQPPELKIEIALHHLMYQDSGKWSNALLPSCLSFQLVVMQYVR